ncbi:hypothetical protein O181_038379 [Austropuccinia psidii MF-1]|uniref:Uncharacterized protein n=1 Tax=Austropuccinia psidii MF-1 TaxID=1389203 RepID=A0A9Q3D885_9BASI|nr:hypothetical protein [Austropuccinia psidii MF-1]
MPIEYPEEGYHHSRESKTDETDSSSSSEKRRPPAHSSSLSAHHLAWELASALQQPTFRALRRQQSVSVESITSNSLAIRTLLCAPLAFSNTQH